MPREALRLTVLIATFDEADGLTAKRDVAPAGLEREPAPSRGSRSRRRTAPSRRKLGGGA